MQLNDILEQLSTEVSIFIVAAVVDKVSGQSIASKNVDPLLFVSKVAPWRPTS